ncbi:hypothetical protein [Lysinibacillus fusiformis]|uniref:hypothetical protein n=1 Tax=Lysinibacillus fusiformis TaxID=28031 RepID=UPI003D0762DE
MARKKERAEDRKGRAPRNPPKRKAPLRKNKRNRVKRRKRKNARRKRKSEGNSLPRPVSFIIK